MINSNNKNNSFKLYITTLLEEKNISLDTYITMTNENSEHIMTVATVVEFITSPDMPEDNTYKIGMTFRMIDFKNEDVMHYINHLGNGIASMYN